MIKFTLIEMKTLSTKHWKILWKYFPRTQLAAVGILLLNAWGIEPQKDTYSSSFACLWYKHYKDYTFLPATVLLMYYNNRCCLESWR